MKEKKLEQTLTSLEVAGMVEKEHKRLLKDIRRYTVQLGEGKIAPTDFWKESTYTTEQNRTMPCYNITKKGCEFIAHKMTGVKGTTFTARYINRFHEMEDVICKNVKEEIASAQDIMKLVTKQTELLEELTDRIAWLEQRLNEDKELKDNATVGIPMRIACRGNGSAYLAPDIVAIRTKELAELVRKVANLLGYEKNIIFRAMYIKVEEKFHISLDSYLEVARREYREDASTLNVIAMWDDFYHYAVELNNHEIESRSIYEGGEQYE